LPAAVPASGGSALDYAASATAAVATAPAAAPVPPPCRTAEEPNTAGAGVAAPVLPAYEILTCEEPYEEGDEDCAEAKADAGSLSGRRAAGKGAAGRRAADDDSSSSDEDEAAAGAASEEEASGGDDDSDDEDGRSKPSASGAGSGKARGAGAKPPPSASWGRDASWEGGGGAAAAASGDSPASAAAARGAGAESIPAATPLRSPASTKPGKRGAKKAGGDAGASASASGDAEPGGADGGWGGERYEKTPAATRYLLRFQRRVRRLPQQCMRYHYGGAPLWPVPPPTVVSGDAGARPAASGRSGGKRRGATGCSGKADLDAVTPPGAAGALLSAAMLKAPKKGKGGGRPETLSIPRCACGAERRFELQLMPHCLEVLSIDAHCTEHLRGAAGAGEGPRPTGAAPASHCAAGAGSTVADTGAASGSCDGHSFPAGSTGAEGPPVGRLDARMLLGNSLDFLTVLVYSCEASCDASHEEFAVAVCDEQ